MSKRTDTFLFVLIQKISSVGVLPDVVLYGCVTLLMTSFDVQQHHGAARHFTSVSAIAQKQIFPNWDMPANCWWCGENLVEFGRIDLAAGRLNRGVLKRKTDLRGGPFIWIWFGLGIEYFIYHIDIDVIYLVWWKMYPLLYPQSLLLWKRNQTRELEDEVKRGTHKGIHLNSVLLLRWEDHLIIPTGPISPGCWW